MANNNPTEDEQESGKIDRTLTELGKFLKLKHYFGCGLLASTGDGEYVAVWEDCNCHVRKELLDLRPVVQFFHQSEQAAVAEAYERGRIAEARTCEQSKRHDIGMYNIFNIRDRVRQLKEGRKLGLAGKGEEGDCE